MVRADDQLVHDGSAATTTIVVNIRSAPAIWTRDLTYVYIGRGGKGLSGDYGNSHSIGRCRRCQRWHTRGDAIETFRAEAAERYRTDAAYRSLVEQLRGKKLVCFCAPQRCHGDVYVELLHESGA